MLNKPTTAQETDWNKLLLNDKDFYRYSSYIGEANGTFGELLQGVLPCDEHYLVTFPINSFTKCIFIADHNDFTLTVFPPNKQKSLTLVKAILHYFKIHLGGKLIVKSSLAEGKGLASSSADLVATAKAMERVLNIKISNELLLTFLRGIEPSDGVMYPGIVSFYHKKVILREYLGTLPNITIIGVDEGGVVDTIEYNKKKRIYTADEKSEYESLLNQMSNAIKNSDLNCIGSISTRSAILNQNHNPKKFLSHFIEICNVIQGLGVIVAHSGTYIGIMLNGTDNLFNLKVKQAKLLLNQIVHTVDVYESLNFVNKQHNYNLNTAMVSY